MTRLPLRWRVTLAFTVAMLVVLTALGAFVYLRFAAELQDSLDRGLRARAAEVGSLVARSPEGLGQAVAPGLASDESVAQVLRADGTVIASSPGARRALIDRAGLRRGLDGAYFADRDGDRLVDESLRLLVAPARLGEDEVVVVVGASRDDASEALSSLLILGVVGLGVALVVAGAAGYAVAGVALRPVDAMRARAEEISDRPDRRLPVPPARDELGRLATTLNEMLDRLDCAGAAEREALDRERRFVADASHELRTPLAVLKSEIEVALMGDRTPAALEAALASAGEETDRLCRLAEDLLLLAEADDPGAVVHREEVDARELLGAVAARESRRVQAAGRRLTVDAPEGLLLRVDPMHLERALGDLVDNALVHGGGAIGLSARRWDGGVAIEVRDHGDGFPDGFSEEALLRFRRASAARTRGGTGLGLALVQAVALAHGGRVSVGDGAPGARVGIVLPDPGPSSPG